MTLAPLMECILRVRHERHERAHELRLLGRRQGAQIHEPLGGGFKRTRIARKSQIPTRLILVNRLGCRGADRFCAVADLYPDKYERSDHAERRPGLTEKKYVFQRHQVSLRVGVGGMIAQAEPQTTVGEQRRVDEG